MAILYRCFVALVSVLLPVAEFFVKKGKFKEFVDGRKTRIPEQALSKKARRFWFHCASLGEFEQAKPVMEALKKMNPEYSLVITFFSPSGYMQRKNYDKADAILYLPLDSPGKARKIVNYLQADVVIFVKYELWYFHLKELFRQNIPVFLISAVFRENQFLFSPAGRFIFQLLAGFRTLFVQDKNSLELLTRKGVSNAMLSGDTRYDRVKQNAMQLTLNDRIQKFKGDSEVIILGSSWPEEEAILKDFIGLPDRRNLKFIIAPHDISESRISDIRTKFKANKTVLYTAEDKVEDSEILILDTIGHLSSAYYYADLAFIGGGFGKGLHNILEALAFGVPVVFGPNIAKYPEARMAIQNEVGSIVRNASDLNRYTGLYLDPAAKEKYKIKCTDHINWHSGATEKVIKSLLETA